jgi:serine protease Do
MSKVRYVYGITAALLIGGSLTNVAVGAQTPLNQPGAIQAGPPRAGAPMSFADLSERLQPAVVNISTRQSISIPRQRSLPPGFEEFFRRFNQQAPGQGGQGGQGEDNVTQRGGSLGSGFIISADGFVVTNNHVVAPARNNAVIESITVTLSDGTELDATVVGRDEASDLAVLKINPRGNLPFVRFADPDQVRVGDWVVAIGNPYALGGSVTAGIVSALHRNINAGTYDRFIQTDASSTKAIPVGRCSTCRAMSSGSTPRSIRRQAAISALALPSPPSRLARSLRRFAAASASGAAILGSVSSRSMKISRHPFRSSATAAS